MSLERSLALQSFDPMGRRLMAGLGPDQLWDLAREIAATDPFREVDRLRSAVQLLDEHGVTVEQYLEHRLWCAQRQARWNLEDPSCDDIPMQVEGQQFIDETAGHPTVLISPLSVAMRDAVAAVSRFRGERQVVFFGQDVEEEDISEVEPGVEIAGQGQAAIARILAVLSARGVFCTYADFVYEGSRTVPTRLFGQERGISSSFVKLAGRDGTMLLPFAIRREHDAMGVTLRLRAWEPILVTGGLRDGAMVALAELITESLARTIRFIGPQWLLLPTLSFSSPQQARARSKGSASGS